MKTIASRKLASTAYLTKTTLRLPYIKVKPLPISIVYYIRICFKDKTTVYKIGYTSMTTDKRVNGYYDRKDRKRKGGMGLPCGCTWVNIAILYRGTREAAFRLEQDLHKQWAGERYYGANRLRNGNTELYKRDILGLDPGYSRKV